jgi:hypothetical protein
MVGTPAGHLYGLDLNPSNSLISAKPFSDVFIRSVRSLRPKISTRRLSI